MSYDLKGRWKAGWALDLHTISSQMNPDNSFSNKRSDIGEALYQLKYQHDRNQVEYLVNEMVKFLKTRLVTPYLYIIFPIPASYKRDFQPVYEIAYKVGNALGIQVDDDFIYKTKETKQLKEIEDEEVRKELIKGAFAVRDQNKYRGKKVLLIDDLFRSGTTLNEVTNTLYNDANVENVYVMTLTKTRSKR